MTTESGRKSPADISDQFRRDGVVNFPAALGTKEMLVVEDYFNSRQEPSDGGSLYPESGATFTIRNAAPVITPLLERVLERTANVVAALFDGPVWLLEHQVHYKHGQDTGVRRTPWHQDASYLPFIGLKSVVLWMSLDPVPQKCALEVVRGSHVGPIFARPRFEGADDTAVVDEDKGLPRLPDIQSQREKWDIVSWPHKPGDVLAFHPAAIHGGGATNPGVRRRSVSLRFVGDDVVRATTKAVREDYLKPIYELEIGQPVHLAGLPQIRKAVSNR